MVILVMGLPGSGKSFFASRLAQVLHADYFNSDRIRMDRLDKRTYSDEEKQRVYDDLLLGMEQSIQQHKNVVLDATFYKNSIREKFMEKANKTDVLACIEVIAAEDLIRKRLSHSREFSEARFDTYQKILREWEPLTEKHLILESTNQNVHIMLQKAIHYLHWIKYEKRGS